MAFGSVKFHGTNKFLAAKCSIFGNYSPRSYTMTEYNGSWFENIWVQHYEVLINEIWRKNFRFGTSNFRIFTEHDSPRLRKNRVFQLGLSIVLSVYNNSYKQFYLHLLALFLIKDFVSYKKKIAWF